MKTDKPHMMITESPWFCDQYGHVYGWKTVESGKKESVILLDGRYSKATTADRRLIASAPKLVEALSPFSRLGIETCHKCDGTGGRPDNVGEACGTCGGTGRIVTGFPDASDVEKAKATLAAAQEVSL